MDKHKNQTLKSNKLLNLFLSKTHIIIYKSKITEQYRLCET